MEIVEFANSIDPFEVAHNEPPHLDLHCLYFTLSVLSMIYSGTSVARTLMAHLPGLFRACS